MPALFSAHLRSFFAVVLLTGVAAWAAAADEAPKTAAPKTAPTEPAATSAPATEPAPALPAAEQPAPVKTLAKDPPGLTRLVPDADAWLDAKNKRVVVDGEVCLREGQLELFACVKRTKEHEAVVAVPVKANVIHAGLLAIGASAGTPVQTQPKYKPATGTTVDITVIWTDAKGTVHHDKAQDWIRDNKTGKAMQHNWVFAGSGFQQEDDGKRLYMADGGDMICVSNFPSAMLDLPVESTQGDASLLFQAFTEHIPPKGTKVRLVLTPRLEKKQVGKAEPEKKDPDKKDLEQKQAHAPAVPAASVAVTLLSGLMAAFVAADEAASPAGTEPAKTVPAPVEPAPVGPAAVEPTPANLGQTLPAKTLAKDPPGMKRLVPDVDVWIDPKNKRVVVDGAVCLREGQLELFACIKGTKEHEAVVAVPVKANVIHAGLLAIGAIAGTPVQFQPKYKAATGTTVDVTVIWTDAKGTVHHDKAQDWIRSIKTGKAMQYNWVFAGSGFWQEEDSSEKHYMADGGDLICVSNFPSAMLDLPVESSQGDNSLLFQAFTEHIPPKGTKVRLVLTPRLEKKDPKATK